MSLLYVYVKLDLLMSIFYLFANDIPTYFRACEGRVHITSCSGLAIISVYPIKEVEFHMYTWRGQVWDGEIFVGTIKPDFLFFPLKK